MLPSYCGWIALHHALNDSRKNCEAQPKINSLFQYSQLNNDVNVPITCTIVSHVAIKLNATNS